MDKKMMDEILQRNEFVQLLGIELLEVREGFASGRMRLQKKYTNNYGGMHGGCTYTLADTMAAIAASTYGKCVTTIDGKMNYLLPVKDTEYVYCDVRAVRQGGRVGLYEAKVMNDQKEVLVTADFTYYRTSAELTEIAGKKEES